MIRMTCLALAAAALATIPAPDRASAYGAAHVGYTHVGPNGVYHEGATVAGGSHGGPSPYAATTHGGVNPYAATTHTSASGEYQYAGGAAYGTSVHYGYCR